MNCEKCGKVSERLSRDEGGLFVCDECNGITDRCPTCSTPIDMESDRIGNHCVECYCGGEY